MNKLLDFLSILWYILDVTSKPYLLLLYLFKLFFYIRNVQ